MNPAEPNAARRFSTSLPIILSTRPVGSGPDDWRELDRGPGYFTIPEGEEAAVRIKGIDDDALEMLVKDLAACPAVIDLILAENRNITDVSMRELRALPWLRSLNLSSCGLSNAGIADLEGLNHLEWLNLSYCNRLTDPCLKSIRELPNLVYLDLQGCVKITHGGVARLRRPNLVVHA